MLNDDQIIQIFKDSVAEVDNTVKVDDLTLGTDIAELGLDSIKTMEVIGVIEERLNLRFPDGDLATLRKISDVAEIIHRSS